MVKVGQSFKSTKDIFVPHNGEMILGIEGKLDFTVDYCVSFRFSDDIAACLLWRSDMVKLYGNNRS